jgi:hypothetical protein
LEFFDPHPAQPAPNSPSTFHETPANRSTPLLQKKGALVKRKNNEIHAIGCPLKSQETLTNKRRSMSWKDFLNLLDFRAFAFGKKLELMGRCA